MGLLGRQILMQLCYIDLGRVDGPFQDLKSAFFRNFSFQWLQPPVGLDLMDLSGFSDFLDDFCFSNSSCLFFYFGLEHRIFFNLCDHGLICLLACNNDNMKLIFTIQEWKEMCITHYNNFLSVTDSYFYIKLDYSNS